MSKAQRAHHDAEHGEIHEHCGGHAIALSSLHWVPGLRKGINLMITRLS